MNKQDGGAAFPETCTQYDSDHEPYVTSVGGMTLRDYGALKALQGFCANPAIFAADGRIGWRLVNCDEEQLINYCYKLADQALAERSK